MSNKSYLPDYHLNLKQNIIAIFLFSALLFAYRYLTFFKIQTHYLGTPDADAGLYVWLFKTNLRDLFELLWFNTKAFYPYTQSLAWSDNFILPAMLGLPLVKLGVPIIIAYNIIILLANFLNGYLTFRFAYQISSHYIGSLISGIVFFSFPFLTLHLGHPQLQFAFWIPLTLIFYCKFFYKPCFVYGFLTGLMVFLSFLTTVYYTIFILMLLEVIFIAFLVQKWNFFKPANLIKLSLSFIVGFLPVLFFVIPYLYVKETFPARTLRDSILFSADFLSYFRSPPFSLFHSYSSGSGHYEAMLFPGAVVLLLGMFTVWILIENKRLRLPVILGSFFFSAAATLDVLSMKFLATLFLWALLFSLIYILFKNGKLERKLKINYITNRGLVITLLFAAFWFYFLSLGVFTDSNRFIDNPTLYSVYYYAFPGASILRAIGRAGIVTIFFLSILIPFALQYLKLKKIYLITVMILFFLSLIENFPRFYPLEAELPVRQAFLDIEKYASDNDVAVALPLSTSLTDKERVNDWNQFAIFNMDYLNDFYPAKIKAVNGYSGIISRHMRALPGKLANFPDQSSLDALSYITNLKFIIVASQNIPDFNRNIFLEKIKAFTQLKLLVEDTFGNYLLSFDPLVELSSEEYLQAPSYPYHQILNFELKTASGTQTTIPISLALKKHFDGKPFHQLSLLADNNWHKYQVTLPKTEDRVRPLFVKFIFEEGQKVYLREARSVERH